MTIRCSFHAYEGETPCPWCAEKAGVADLGAYVPPADACKHCGSPEMRKNEVGGWRWCGACGKRADDTSGTPPRVTSVML